MARGNWRNWDIITCPKCGSRAYKKYTDKGKCPKCKTKMKLEVVYDKRNKEKP